MALNSAQHQAVHYFDGPLLVLAGAGSGKTRVITEKMACLVRQQNMPPERIHAITFTNKAAREMRARVGKLMDTSTAQSINVSTFHALGLRFLQQELDAAGLRRGFSIFDGDDSLSVTKDLLPQGTDKAQVQHIRHQISALKQKFLDADHWLSTLDTKPEDIIADVWRDYADQLKQYNAVDFDDLITMPLKLLQQESLLRDKWRARMGYVLVDEYQDTNGMQYQLMKALVGSKGQFTVVGDDDQSIYAWRGARPENLIELKQDFPNLHTVKLEQNYRCKRRILNCANAVIANNSHLFEKKLWSQFDDGEPIRVLTCKDPEDEAKRVANEIGFLARRDGIAYQDFAILYRSNHQSRPLEQALQMRGVPYTITGSTGFLQRAEVKNLLAWLRLTINPDDDAAFIRAVTHPKRDAGKKTLAQLNEHAATMHTSLFKVSQRTDVLKRMNGRSMAGLDDFAKRIRTLQNTLMQAEPETWVSHLVDASEITKRCTDATDRMRMSRLYEELSQWFISAGDSGKDIAQVVALMSQPEQEESGNQVRMMSLHSAKGLEFPYVFIIGMEDGTLPHEMSVDDGQIEEERRLFYVGITRAKKFLHLSYAKSKKRFGEWERNLPSRFLSELPSQDIEREGGDEDPVSERQAERIQSSMEEIQALLGLNGDG